MTTALLYLSARNAGKIDAFLPLLVHLAAQKSKIDAYTVVLFEDTDDDLRRSLFHLEAVDSLSTYFRPHIKSKILGRFRAVYKFLALFFLLSRLWILRRRILVLAPWKAKSFSEKNLFKLISCFGQIFHFPSLQVPTNSDYMLRFTNWDKLQSIGVKKPGKITFTSPLPAVCYLETEKQYILRDDVAEPIAIGIPRLYPSWIPFVRSFGGRQLSRALEQIGMDSDTPKFGVVILTNPSYHWFPNGDSDYPAMLREIIESSRRHFPGMPILLKPKPNMRGLFETLLRKNGLLGDDVHLIDLGLAALASRAAWAATINESSGAFDFLCTNVPTIEYARYAPHWLEITPSGSAWRSLPGLIYVESREALDQAMRSTSRGELDVDNRQRLAEFFGHKENLELFFQ